LKELKRRQEEEEAARREEETKRAEMEALQTSRQSPQDGTDRLVFAVHLVELSGGMCQSIS